MSKRLFLAALLAVASVAAANPALAARKVPRCNIEQPFRNTSGALSVDTVSYKPIGSLCTTPHN